MLAFLKYCYYRMYLEYEAKDDSPRLRSLVYISILESFIVFVMLIHAEEITTRIFNIQNLDIENPMYIWITVAMILVANYFFFSRLSIKEMDRHYENRKKLNRSVKIWMLVVLPFAIFFGGIVVFIVLFGGEIAGEPISGLF